VTVAAPVLATVKPANQNKQHDKNSMSTNTLPDTTTPATLPARVTTINAEKFRNACLFRLRISRFGNRAKIKDGSKLTEYLSLKKQQEQEQTELGQPRTIAPAITGDISGSVTATKRLMVSPALDAVNELLTQTKEKLVGRFGIMAPSNIPVPYTHLTLPKTPYVEVSEGALTINKQK